MCVLVLQAGITCVCVFVPLFCRLEPYDRRAVIRVLHDALPQTADPRQDARLLVRSVQQQRFFSLPFAAFPRGELRGSLPVSLRNAVALQVHGLPAALDLPHTPGL